MLHVHSSVDRSRSQVIGGSNKKATLHKTEKIRPASKRGSRDKQNYLEAQQDAFTTRKIPNR